MESPESENTIDEKKPDKENAKTSIVDAVWDLLSSTRFAVILIIFIAAASLLGAFLPQMISDRELAMLASKWGESLVSNMNKLGLFDLYHSKWFQGSLALLCVSIFICSMDRFPRAIRLIKKRDTVLASGDPERLRINHSFYYQQEQGEAAEGLRKWLRSKRLRAAEDTRGDNRFFFINRGAYSRLGVYAVHASLILVVIGAMIGNIAGFNGRLGILEGASDDKFERFGKLHGFAPLGFEVRCDSFSFTVDPETGMVGNYLSKLVILDGGIEIDKVDLRVNHPYHFKGISLYQQSYELAGIESASIKVFSPDSRELGEVTLPGDGSLVELPGGGEMRIVGVRPGRSQTITEISAAVKTIEAGEIVMKMSLGEKSVPTGGTYKVHLLARNLEDDSIVQRFALQEGEEVALEKGITVKLADYLPTFPVHGKEESAARIEVTSNGETRRHVLFEPFPDFDKMNIQGKIFYSIEKVEQMALNGEYNGLVYVFASSDDHYRTVIEVGRDPGVPVVYAGFILMLVGLYVAFFWSHRKIWIKIEPGRLSMGGTVNRNAVGFEESFRKIARELETALSGKFGGGSGK